MVHLLAHGLSLPAELILVHLLFRPRPVVLEYGHRQVSAGDVTLLSPEGCERIFLAASALSAAACISGKRRR